MGAPRAVRAQSPRQLAAWQPDACHGARCTTAFFVNCSIAAFAHRRRLRGLPEEHNRVTLDADLKDSHGIPVPRIDHRISENTRQMMERGIARVEEIVAPAGATRIQAWRTVLNSPGHLLGTTRMGEDPGW